MAIQRVLERGEDKVVMALAGKVLTIDGERTTFERERDAGQRLLELTRTRLGQGWKPAAKPAAAAAFTRALEANDVDMWDWVIGLDDAELAVAYRDAMKRGVKISLEVLRRRPTRELFAWLLARFDAYYEDDWTKAVKFLAKDPAQAAWIGAELRAAKKLPTERAKKFAERNAKKLAAGPKPAPVAPTKPVADEAALLGAIAAEPQDDAPRLVYADWLLDRGDGFGELIQVACTFAKLADDAPERAAMRDQLDKLERKHAQAWLAPIRAFVRTCSFERGLISWLTCDAKLFAQAAPTIAARAPRASLQLTGLKAKDVPALAASPLGGFALVGLDSQRIDDAQLTVLAASPTIAGVEYWQLGYNSFGDAGLIAFARSPYVASVQTLQINGFQRGVRFSPAALGEVLASPTLGALCSLSLAVTEIGDAFARCTRKLDHLALSVDRFDDDDAAALAGARSLAGLTSLTIQQVGTQPLELSDEGALRILAKLPRAKLTSSVELGPKVLAEIAKR